jgi:molybdopterin converting factor small subunit
VNVTVLLFAQARERAGRGSLSVELPEGSCIADLLGAVTRDHPGLAPLWPHLAVALDGELTSSEATLREGAEVALLPPVSGG